MMRKYKIGPNVIESKSGKGIMVEIDTVPTWLPKNQCQIEDGYVLIPDWLDNRREKAGAQFSDDRKHIYFLWRIWNASKDTVLCIGLNPSTANVHEDDPTISRLKAHLNILGYGGLIMVNLFSIISSNPEVLNTIDVNDKESMKTDLGIIFGQSINCKEIIFCWGRFKQAQERADRLINFFTEALCFGKNKDGSPWHPQALMYAGFKTDSTAVRLFNFNKHSYDDNKYNKKRKNIKKEVDSYHLATNQQTLNLK